MGTCISKCCLNPSSNLPQDKLVISQSPLPPKNQQELSTTTSSATSTSTSLSSSSSTCTSASCSSSSTSKLKPYTNDFLLSCAKAHPHIITLDPHKYDVPKPKWSNIDPPIIPKLVKLPSKRERSSSPQRSIVRQKRAIINQTMQAVSKLSRASSSTNNVLEDRHRCCERKENVRPLNSCNSLKWLNPKQSSRATLVEDFDNPLISMECFIFL